ncbi:MAG: hypothetical protein ABSA57_01725 [Candidatus Acidiferrales bacterium]
MPADDSSGRTGAREEFPGTGHFLHQPVEHEFRSVAKDGHAAAHSNPGFAPILSESGEPLRIVGSSLDITDRKLAEDKIQESEVLLAQAKPVANLGSLEGDLETHEVT